MITLDLDISYLCSRYHIASLNIMQYKKQNMSIEQIMEAEIRKGNLEAAKMLMQITSNPDELSKLFQLVNPQNRFLLLSNMNRNDLLMIIELLEPEELVLGLSIFNVDILTDLMMRMDTEVLSNLVLSTMKTEKFLQMLPEKFLDEFLSSDKLDKGILMEAIQNVDEEQLQKMMESFSGESCYDSKNSIIDKLGAMNDDDFRSAMFMFEPEGKQQLINGVLIKKPELFKEFSPEALVYPFKQMNKGAVLQSLLQLKTKDMIPMIEQMPEEILSLIATQIDPSKFAEILCHDFADVIAKCGIKF